MERLGHAHFILGSDKGEKYRATIRKLNFGHGFDASSSSKKGKYLELMALNRKFESMHIYAHDVVRYCQDLIK